MCRKAGCWQAEGDQCVLDVNECRDKDYKGGSPQQRNDRVSPVSVWVKSNVYVCCSLLNAS